MSAFHDSTVDSINVFNAKAFRYDIQMWIFVIKTKNIWFKISQKWIRLAQIELSRWEDRNRLTLPVSVHQRGSLIIYSRVHSAACKQSYLCSVLCFFYMHVKLFKLWKRFTTKSSITCVHRQFSLDSNVVGRKTLYIFLVDLKTRCV